MRLIFSDLLSMRLDWRLWDGVILGRFSDEGRAGSDMGWVGFEK
jgi:hypothetical protein